MVQVTLGTTPSTIIKDNPRRKVLSITNTHASAIVYIDTKGQPEAATAKWILYPHETLFFDNPRDHPERAFFGVSDTASTVIQVGFVNE